MKKTLVVSLLMVLVLTLGVSVMYSITSPVVGRWVGCNDPKELVELQANGRYHAVFQHTIGWVDTYGSFDVDDSVSPAEIYYTISTIYIDGQQGRVGPSPGDEISGIWKIEGGKLYTAINDDPWQPPPTSWEKAGCFQRVE